MSAATDVRLLGSVIAPSTREQAASLRSPVTSSRHTQCADECPLLGVKRTVTIRCLPISIMSTRPSRTSAKRGLIQITCRMDNSGVRECGRFFRFGVGCTASSFCVARLVSVERVRMGRSARVGVDADAPLRPLPHRHDVEAAVISSGFRCRHLGPQFNGAPRRMSI